jgi:hypothetical protein
MSLNKKIQILCEDGNESGYYWGNDAGLLFHTTESGKS